MHEIVLDTETTGMDPTEGHRIIEIGCIELMNHLPTGRQYHCYLNPERDVPPDAVAVHGITSDMLADKPVFSQEFTNFLDFIGSESKLVIHNAAFDMKFLNHELKRVGHPGIKNNRVIDSLAIARKKFPGSPANLDALCRRFNIDLSSRELHGALLDAQLLGDVWLELMGGRQHGLGIDPSTEQSGGDRTVIERTFRPARSFPISPEESAAHALFLEKLQDPLWKKIQA
ncbi:MAG: DNA polymerase III subunit epsilon [Rhodospirillales bacterium]|nr:DNA polymerase III subunit epsilon [Rhodospirillales bacterium]MCB9973848.1 DNA polymerase III subunit epsilon [Rhodospirillales bacterium]MCB9980495.1 DNA polymerase III subunit epsilon [Rhodospirillales bacterium]